MTKQTTTFTPAIETFVVHVHEYDGGRNFGYDLGLFSNFNDAVYAAREKAYRSYRSSYRLGKVEEILDGDDYIISCDYDEITVSRFEPKIITLNAPKQTFENATKYDEIENIYLAEKKKKKSEEDSMWAAYEMAQAKQKDNEFHKAKSLFESLGFMVVDSVVMPA